LPPIIILTGALDVAVPPAPLAEFCEKVRQAKNRCELEIYPGAGHMLEPPEGSGTAKEEAGKTRYDAYLKAEQFLVSMGYILLSKPKN
jgi:acetyl esterase/lipase